MQTATVVTSNSMIAHNMHYGSVSFGGPLKKNKFSVLFEDILSLPIVNAK